MEFVVNANTIIGLAGLVSAVFAIVGIYNKGFKQVEKWESYDAKIEEVKQEVKTETKKLQDEQFMQTKVLLAVLEGLQQQGCNGNVTKAHSDLTQFLNERAH